jgi:hypothetical protein
MATVIRSGILLYTVAHDAVDALAEVAPGHDARIDRRLQLGSRTAGKTPRRPVATNSRALNPQVRIHNQTGLIKPPCHQLLPPLRLLPNRPSKHLAVSRFSIFCVSHPQLMNPCLTIQVVGIVLAVVSGVLIGSSFVFKKKGLLRSQAGQTAGEGVAYLKSVRLPPFRFSPLAPKLIQLRQQQVLWWTGMICASCLPSLFFPY